ncbi:hypothetical protein [Rhizobium ruizarguesonis]|uniref:hypothetical protein n=1 Tax=Rhizobium ruizarguesonis TaxID=2081791 RepID=UPI0003661F68|nr:hypothetical protein [Rhizobium ruizarguesonis]TBD89432.1 hypothetical protein ELH14_07010 [Rhizobium ruizarguesonis]
MPQYWRGKDYGYEENSLGGARLLVLGEAHHHKQTEIGTEVPGLTEEVVRRHVNGALGSHSRLFSMVERLVTRQLGQSLDRIGRESFWNSVVFANYIPVIAARKPKQRPPSHLWDGAAPQLYRELVKRVEAEIVLVCGRQLWRKKPHDIAIKGAYKVGERPFEAHVINWSDSYGAVATHILHPSGSFGWSYEENLPPIDYLFRVIDERRAVHGTAPVRDFRG